MGNKMAQEAKPWEEFQPTQPAAGQGVVIPKAGPTQREISAEERAQSAEARAAASAEREAIRFAQEQEAGGGAKPTEAQQKTLTLLTRIAGGTSDISNALSADPEAQQAGLFETLSRNVLGEGVVTRSIAGPDRRIVTDAQTDILDALLTLGTGAAYNREQLIGQTLSYFPQYGDTKAEINIKNDRLKRLIEAARIQAGPLASKFDETIKPLFKEAAPAVTDRAAQLQDAFNKGSSLQELNALASTLGISPNQDDLLKAVEFRDAGGVGARILPPEAGAAPEETGFFEGIIETVTGSERSTPEIEALPEWTTMPELNELSVAGARTGIGTMFTSPEESVKIIQANYPGVQVRQDTKGNYILRSQDGREYGIKPGFRWSDVPRALGGILAFTPAGRAATVAGSAGGAALTQAGIEATQAGAGGTFDTGEIAIAGGAGAAGKVIEQALPVVVSAVRGMRGGPAAALPETIPAGAASEAPPAMAMPSPVAMAPEAPVAPVAPVVTPAATPEAAAELGTIIRQASGADAKAKGAQIKLSEMAQINPEARAAAERLGIDVPADVFSDNPQVRAAVGLTRSLAGSEAEAAWRNSVSAAVDQADNILREFDAQFIEGAIAPGVVSQRVKDSLTGTRASLNKEASDIYKQVDAAVPKQTPVQMDNLFRELNLIAGEVGESGMTAQEKRLMSLIQSGEAAGGDITYGRLIREKNLIGKALKREESPYGSLDEATLKRLYGALATDQLDNVGRVAGEEVRSQLRGANLIYAKERALGDRIVNAFGRDLEGGIANKMRAAITSGAKGDAGDFARLMKTVPEDLRREVVATALGSVSRSARGAEKGGFGFSEFADLYPKLRANPPVYKQIVETLGPKAADTLRDLYQVSKRITEARANVLTTGKANQALVESLNAEGIVSRIMDSTMAKRAVGAAAGFAGPVAGAVMPDIMQAMAKGNPDAIRAAGKMFSSPEFQVLLTEAATQPKIADRAINRVATSARFRDFAKTIGLDMKDAKTWLRSATAPAAVAQGEQAPMPETSGAPVVRIQQ
jgi:hypothetical protein